MKPVHSSNSAFYHLKLAAKLAVINTWAFCKRVAILFTPPQLRPYQQDQGTGFLGLRKRKVNVEPDLIHYNTDALYEHIWPSFDAVLMDFVEDSNTPDKNYGGQFKLNGTRVEISILPKLKAVRSLDELISLINEIITGSSKTYLLLKLHGMISQHGDTDFLSEKSKAILENTENGAGINPTTIPTAPDTLREFDDIKAGLLNYTFHYYQSLDQLSLEKIYVSDLFSAIAQCKDLQEIKHHLFRWEMPSVQSNFQDTFYNLEQQKEEERLQSVEEMEQNIRQSLNFLIDDFIQVKTGSHSSSNKSEAGKAERRDSYDSALGDDISDDESLNPLQRLDDLRSNSSEQNAIDEGAIDEIDSSNISDDSVSFSMSELQLSHLKMKLNKLTPFTKKTIEQAINELAPEQAKDALLTSLYEDYETYGDLLDEQKPD